MKRVRQKPTRVFRGMPVVEAQASMHVQPSAADIRSAIKEDPEHCAYANCLRRTLEAPNVFVFRTVAYVQSLDRQGKPIMLRYMVRKHANDYLTKFDQGKAVAPGGFMFHAPSKCRTLEYKYKQEVRRRTAGRQSPRVATGEKHPKRQFSWRKGTGRVHFYGKEDQISIPAH